MKRERDLPLSASRIMPRPWYDQLDAIAVTSVDPYRFSRRTELESEKGCACLARGFYGEQIGRPAFRDLSLKTLA